MSGSIPGGVFTDPDANSNPVVQQDFLNTLVDDSGNAIDFTTGSSTIVGGNGETVFESSNGDILFQTGGTGNNVVTTFGSDFIVQGGSGSDTIVAGGGDNSIILNDAANNAVTGASGNDTIFGGSGNDVIFGDKGDDFIGGGAGNDTMTGGQGSDVFIVMGAGAASGDVVITDMQDELGQHDILYIQGHQHGDGVFNASDYTIVDHNTDASVAVGDAKILFNGDAGSVTLKGVGDASNVIAHNTGGDDFFTVDK